LWSWSDISVNGQTITRGKYANVYWKTEDDTRITYSDGTNALLTSDTDLIFTNVYWSLFIIFYPENV
jgi:hypothetical protein